MHQALYRKWRPADFDSVCGQDHITSILKYEIENEKITHAYLFCGSRGTGKTTCAKILAKAVNCEHPINGNPCNECPSCKAIDSGSALDVYEMDAASNNGIDNIRDIRDEVLYTPSELKNRVYIIDEVHMLSVSAFNALLKTLEEPPENVIFILATTEIQKIPATILSRCQRFDFRRISSQVIADRLLYIAGQEKIETDDDAAYLIAKLSNGGMRDAISMLELCSGENAKITKDVVVKTTGINSRENIIKTVNAILDSDFETILSQINELYISSLDIAVFWNELMSFYRDMFVVKNTANSRQYIDLSESEFEELKEFAKRFTNARILSHIKELENAFSAMQKPNSSKRICAEMSLIKLCDQRLSSSFEALNERLTVLEEKLAKGNLQTGADNIKKTEFLITQNEKTEEHNDSPLHKEEPKNTTEVRETKEMSLLLSWPEIAKKYSRTDMSISSFLQMSSAFKCGDEIIIRVPGRFTFDMLSQTSVKEALAGIISSVENTSCDPKNIKIEIQSEEEKQDENAGIDEIISNSNN